MFILDWLCPKLLVPQPEENISIIRNIYHFVMSPLIITGYSLIEFWSIQELAVRGKEVCSHKPSKKTEAKKKEKVIEVKEIYRSMYFSANVLVLNVWNVLWQDKTFGLKNKKGNKNQKYIAQVEKQVKSGGDPRAKKVEEERAAERKKKEEAKKEEEERKALFKPIVPSQKVESGMFSKYESIVNSVWG